MGRFILHLPPEEIQKIAAQFQPDDETMEAIGFFLQQQVSDRFQTQGASGGARWPGKRFADGRAILTGVTGQLAESFQSYGIKTPLGGEAVVFSEVPYAHVHQLGTKGKGGVLPDIVPKNAKALFIPLTDRAKTSRVYRGVQAKFFRDAHGASGSGAYRVATRGPKMPSLNISRALVRGRIHKGKLQRWNDRDEEWEDGQPDFIFLMKVSIPPRPMLPDSPAEQKAQDDFVRDILVEP